jgi:lysophospholipase L1-like esterase
MSRRALVIGLVASLLLNLALVAIPIVWSWDRGGVAYLWSRLRGDAPGPDRRYADRAVLHALLPAVPTDLVMFGDSITADGPWSELLPDRRVLNRGISGDTVAGALERVSEVTRRVPSAVFVLLGVNDLLKRRPVVEILGDYERLLTILRADLPSARLVVQSVLPVNVQEPNGREDVVAALTPLNDGLAALAPRFGAHWLDLRPAFADAPSTKTAAKPDLMVDFLHLSARGYLVWAEEVKRALAVASP